MTDPAESGTRTFDELLLTEPLERRVPLRDVNFGDQGPKTWEVPVGPIRARCDRSGKEETFRYVARGSPFSGGPRIELDLAYVCAHCSQSVLAFRVALTATSLVFGEKLEQFPRR